jgi:hypothetical protein
MKSSACLAASLGACLLMPGAATHVLAQDFVAGATYHGGTLSVVSANGFSRSAFSENGVPDFSSLGRLPDGDYTYQLTAASNRLVRIASQQNNGRAAVTNVMRQGASASGAFEVRGGMIVLPAAGRAAGNGDQD